MVTRLYVQHDQDGKEPSVLQTHSRQVNLKFLLSNLERIPAKLTASSEMIVSQVAFLQNTKICVIDPLRLLTWHFFLFRPCIWRE